MTAPQTLAGRTALVTGASRGIGRAIARRLAAHGAAVVVTSSRRSQADLHETRRLIEHAGGRAAEAVADLGDPRERADLVLRATSALGAIEILVNNAAAIPAYAPPSKADHASRAALFEINVQAPIDLMQQALPVMRERGWGRIVNISSEMARQPPIPYPSPPKMVHNLALYGATKAALERCTTGLAAELHGSGIRVNAVAPYKIALSEAALALARQVAEAHPDWIEPVEMMAEAVYLLVTSETNGWIGVSRDLLRLQQAPLHALDGRTVIGDALTLGRVEASAG